MAAPRGQQSLAVAAVLPTHRADSGKSVCSRTVDSAREWARPANPSAQFAPSESESRKPAAPATPCRAAAATRMPASRAELASSAPPSTAALPPPSTRLRGRSSSPLVQPWPPASPRDPRSQPVSFPVALRGLADQVPPLSEAARPRVVTGSLARPRGDGSGEPLAQARKSHPVSAAPNVVASPAAAPQLRRRCRRPEKPTRPPAQVATRDGSTPCAGAGCFESAT